MRLFHVTTMRAWRSILRDMYLDPMRSRGKRLATWFVPEYRVEWAMCHTQIRHGTKVEDLVILEFNFEDGEVSEHAGSGKYFRMTKTPMNRCLDLFNAHEWMTRDPEPRRFVEWGPEAAG